jgi:hypothetical protein
MAKKQTPYEHPKDVCTRFHELMHVQRIDYQKQLELRKAYFDNLTKEDVWIYLVERDFQKKYFEYWAKEAKEVFCSQCEDKCKCKCLDDKLKE